MKKEEFLARLRKNLSVLEEREIQDIVEEYEQHIDMKMKEGLTEEAAIKDFGELQELTSGILEAYHVKAESLNATNAFGKGAGALGKCLTTAGRWSARQIKKLGALMIMPFIRIKDMLKNSKKRAQGRGFWGKVWLLIIGCCGLIWAGIKWCLWLMWNCFWLCIGIGAGLGTLVFIFIFGIMAVLLLEGYPVIGLTIVSVGGGMMSAAFTMLCFVMLRKHSDKKDKEDNGDRSIPTEENDWEYPEELEEKGKQIIGNKCQEVLHHA